MRANYRVMIQRTREGEVIFSGWEPYAGHSTMFDGPDGARYGEMMSRPLPAELDALSTRSEERPPAVRAWREALREEVYAAIVSIRPEAAVGERFDGEIWLPAPGKAKA